MTGEPGEALSQRRLNRSLLARQLLLERSTLPIPAVLDQLVGIQNQYAPNAYIRLWSCVEGFQRDDLTRAYEQGSVVQGTLMRGTIHTVSPGDYHPMVAAVRASRRDWAEKIHRQSAADRDELIARVRSAVGGRTLTRAELVELRAGASDAAWQTIDTDAELLRVPPSGTWERRRADVFGLADDVIGRHDELPEADGLAPVARRYLAGFGPASVGTWRRSSACRSLRSSRSWRRWSCGGTATRRAESCSTSRMGRCPDADTPAPVRFLPTWDATLLVHARRTQILPEVYRPRIFHTKMPPSYPTFLVDGQVAGTWRFEDGHVVLDPFATVARGDRRALDEEAERLAAFHA